MKIEINESENMKSEEVKRPLRKPFADIFEEGENYIMYIEMPGVPDNGLDIEVEDSVLTIKGRSDEIDVESRKHIYSEWTYSDYARAFEIGRDINAEKITADIKDGVLKLVLPKSEKLKPRKIEIKKS